MEYPKVLIMLLGHPGSGKSYFARQLAERISAVRINGDAMRKAMFGSFERAREFDQKEPINPMVFGALDYVGEQIIASGSSVIYDAQHNQKDLRTRMSNVARRHKALPLLIWIKTPYHIAVERGQTRAATEDQQHSKEKMEESIKKHQAALELPTNDEIYIEIDGTLSFEEQYKDFEEKLKVILKTHDHPE